MSVRHADVRLLAELVRLETVDTPRAAAGIALASRLELAVHEPEVEVRLEGEEARVVRAAIDTAVRGRPFMVSQALLELTRALAY